MTGYHTRWVRPETEAEDPERLAIREALAGAGLDIADTPEGTRWQPAERA